MVILLKSLGLFIFLLSYPLWGAEAKGKKDSKKVEEDQAAEIYDRSAEHIAKNFMFIGDFEQKEETRVNGKEIFWRYPFTLPKVSFDLDFERDFSSDGLQKAFPPTEGKGRAIEHLNRGRAYFLAGEVEEARKTWLSGRARYGKSYEFHRRTDHFIAQAFFYRGLEKWEAHGRNFDIPEVRQDFVNASTFVAWAFDRKKDLYDPLLEQLAPRVLYNQATVYFNYGRWAGVVGAVSNALDFLRKTGRKEYRREFRRMMAEVHIRNRNYLDAVQELDLTLRQDEDLATAAAIFARIGDIYFDLNNFELAEEVYAAANKIDRELQQIRPSQYILRGESLFWLGRFEEARLTFQYALKAASLPKSIENLSLDMEALASLRIADSYLAKSQWEEAKLRYFEHAREFRQHITSKYANIRLACLELPAYEGNNILHARESLSQLKLESDLLPSPAIEMAWTCETASYAQHERNKELVERVRVFYQQYPHSEFLQSLVQPVREVQAKDIDRFIEAKDYFGLIKFFEQTRSFLYPEPSELLQQQLFEAYVMVKQTAKAKEFLPAFQKKKKSDRDWLLLTSAMVELSEAAEGREKQVIIKENKELARTMESLDMRLPMDDSTKLFFRRILEPHEGVEHLPWILNQTLRWVETDVSTACDFVYPLLQRITEVPEQAGRFLYSKASYFFIDNSLKDLLRFETNCAYSLMEFEIALYRNNISQLAKSYLKRDYIPFNPTVLAILWSVSELTYKSGDEDNARLLWNLIVSKGTPESREVRFAQTRLKSAKTELDDLWQKQ